MMRSIPPLLTLALCVGCSAMTTQSESRALETTLVAYANAIRWGDFEQALAFVDKETLKEHPLSATDMERYKQVKVAAYTEQPPEPVRAHEVRQIVQISLVNINTQTERSIVDKQLWRYDEEGKHWHLISGLPDIIQH